MAKKYDEAEDKLSLQAELAAVKYAVTNAAISIVDKSMRIVGAKKFIRKKSAPSLLFKRQSRITQSTDG
ncbi:hypothetical protein ACT7DM_19630 [Bacillus cereus]